MCHSSGVSSPCLCRMSSAMAIFPRSCRKPPRRQRQLLFFAQSDEAPELAGVVGQALAVAFGVGIARLDAAPQGAQHGVGVLQLVGVVLYAQQRGDAGKQLDGKDWLVEEVVGAGFDAANLVLEVAQPGDHDDRNQAGFGRVLPLAAEFVSALSGHDDVEQHQIGLRLAHDLFGGRVGVPGDQHFIALAGEQFAHEHAVFRDDRPRRGCAVCGYGLALPFVSWSLNCKLGLHQARGLRKKRGNARLLPCNHAPSNHAPCNHDNRTPPCWFC